MEIDIELVPLCSVEGTLRKPMNVGDGPSGRRLVIEIAAMTLTGRLEAELAGVAGADWATLTGDVGTLDVRATVKTTDDALIFITYEGRMPLSGDAAGTLYVTPKFETGDERYAWLNGIQAVGKGRADGADLRYEWFEVR